MDIPNEIIKVNSTNDYVNDIKNIITLARQSTCRVINSVMVMSYWLVGKRIFEEEQNGKNRADYGAYILQNLSKSLNEEFGEGFSYANLRNMRQFYRTYPDEQICYTICSKLSWSHNRLIMRVDDIKARMFYLMCAEKEETVVKYSVLNGSQQLFATKYLPYMPTEEELRRALERNMPLAIDDKHELNNN